MLIVQPQTPVHSSFFPFASTTMPSSADKPELPAGVIIRRKKSFENQQQQTLTTNKRNNSSNNTNKNKRKHREINASVFRSSDFGQLTTLVDTVDSWYNPITSHSWSLPAGRNNERAFGYRGTKGNGDTGNGGINTGVYLESTKGATVCCVEDGVVISIKDYRLPSSLAAGATGLKLKTIYVEGATGVVTYSGLFLDNDIRLGMVLNAGEELGTIGTRFLKIELFTHETKSPVFWPSNQEKPRNLQDPTPLLLSQIIGKNR